MYRPLPLFELELLTNDCFEHCIELRLQNHLVEGVHHSTYKSIVKLDQLPKTVALVCNDSDERCGSDLRVPVHNINLSVVVSLSY